MRDSKDDDLVCSVDFFFFFKLLRNVKLYISEPHLQGWVSLYSAHYLKKKGRHRSNNKNMALRKIGGVKLHWLIRNIP